MTDRIKKLGVTALFAIGLVGFSLSHRKLKSVGATSSQPPSEDDASMVPTSVATNPSPPTTTSTSVFRDGTFTGDSVDTFYGPVQIAAVVSNGKITNIKFLNYPQDRRQSQQISAYALPRLRSEAIQIQTANVDTISGASQTSAGFRASLASALNQAQ